MILFSLFWWGELRRESSHFAQKVKVYEENHSLKVALFQAHLF